jgi:Tfp pilus assembly protein PilO
MKKAMYVLAAIAAMAAIGFALYWMGLSQGRSQLEAERKSFNSRLEQMNSRLALAESNVRINQARFFLCRAVSDLDQRNFGLAGNNLKEAYGALGDINASAAGVDPARFEALKKEIGETQINITVNLNEQRARIAWFGEQLEAMLPRAPAPAAGTEQPAAPRPAAK